MVRKHASQPPSSSAPWEIALGRHVSRKAGMSISDAQPPIPECKNPRPFRPACCRRRLQSLEGVLIPDISGHRFAADLSKEKCMFISQKVFIKPFCKSPFPHKSVDGFVRKPTIAKRRYKHFLGDDGARRPLDARCAWHWSRRSRFRSATPDFALLYGYPIQFIRA